MFKMNAHLVISSHSNTTLDIKMQRIEHTDVISAVSLKMPWVENRSLENTEKGKKREGGVYVFNFYFKS